MAEETSVMQVIPKLVDFVEWIIPALDKFPKSRKFLLADRIETGLLDVLDKLIEANYSREKIVLLKRVNLELVYLGNCIRSGGVEKGWKGPLRVARRGRVI